jgi:outer membrane receptor protein involved in Fe transport
VRRALALCTFLTCARAAAQPAGVEGLVVDARTGAAVAGATIIGTNDGIAVSDDDGHFVLASTTGPVVVVSAPGYATRTISLAALRRGRIALEPAPTEVIEVTDRAPDQTKPVSYSLSQDEIHELPGAGNDALRAVQVLPGVSRIPYSFGGIVVRGMSPRDTEVYLDGIEVPIAFHFGGITSFYPSGMLSDLSITSGGFDVSYGHAQAGIVTMTTREPRTDRWRVGGSIGLLDSGVTAEGPIAGGSVIFGVRRSYLDQVAQLVVDDDVPLPSYWDVQLRGSWGDPARLGRITPMVFLSIDQVSNRTSGAADQPEHIAITSMFVRVAVPYLRQWGPLALRIVPWLGVNRLAFDDVIQGSAETFERPDYPGGVRAELARDYAWGHLRGGFDGEGGYLSRSQVGLSGAGDGPEQLDGASTLSWLDAAWWSEARVRIAGDRLSIKPGVRLERYGLTREWTLDPRLNVTEQLTDVWALRQALGRFHQPPTPADVDPLNGNSALKSSYVDQASLGLDGRLSEASNLSLTGFYYLGHRIGVREPRPNDANDIPDPTIGGLGPTFEMLLEKQLGFSFYRGNQGRARSYGVELLFKHSTGPWFGLVSYTLSKSERVDFPPAVFGAWRPFELDQRHNLNLAGSVALQRWRLGARVQLVSGNPYTPTTCAIVGGGLSCESKPFGGQLPAFFQLDVRADRRWHRCWGDIDLYFDIQNASNYGNVEGRELDNGVVPRDRDIPGLPIIPFIGVEFLPK